MAVMDYNNNNNARRKRFISYEENTFSHGYQKNVYNHQQMYKNSSDNINQLHDEYISNGVKNEFENKIAEIENKLAVTRQKIAEYDNRMGETNLIGEWLKSEGQKRGYPKHAYPNPTHKNLDGEHIMVSIMETQLRKVRKNALSRLGSEKEIKHLVKQANRRLGKAEFDNKNRANLIALVREDIHAINDIIGTANNVREMPARPPRTQPINPDTRNAWQKPDPSLLKPATRPAKDLLRSSLEKRHEQ